MLADIVERLGRGGVASRAAIADTAGAAWAAARYATGRITVVPAGETAAALRRLPIAALRLDGETVAGLTRLGLRPHRPASRRAPGAARAAVRPQVIRRIDQALGRVSEPIEPIAPPDMVRCAAGVP